MTPGDDITLIYESCTETPDVLSVRVTEPSREDKSAVYVFCSTPAVFSGARPLRLLTLIELTETPHPLPSVSPINRLTDCLIIVLKRGEDQ